eukprot:scaffold63502_cov28-Attheya_sp.AAC.2
MKMTGASGRDDSGRGAIVTMRHSRNMFLTTNGDRNCVIAAEGKGAQILEKMNATHMKHQVKRIE